MLFIYNIASIKSHQLLKVGCYTLSKHEQLLVTQLKGKYDNWQDVSGTNPAQNFNFIIDYCKH